MRLKSIKFSQYEGKAEEWGFDCTWGDINLVVGRNATGKTRLLNVVSDLAQMLSGTIKIISFINYEVIFEYNDHETKYLLKTQKGQVVYEELIENGKQLLYRKTDSVGQIWAVQFAELMKFQPPLDTLAVVNRRDTIQHPFLEKMYDWAINAYQFKFGTSMGQNAISLVDFFDSALELDIQKLDSVNAMFAKGNKREHGQFETKIKNDMEKIGYLLENISTLQEETFITPHGIRETQELRIQEQGLPFFIFQNDISSGMFRALSLLIQINYLLLASEPSCFIIDDIGEGLDFSRSTKLIKLLIEKVKGSQIQLIMSTNDQFVMDAVPLEYWQIIQREGNQLRIYNYHNSKAIFDKFEFTGLGNFDFFSSNYFLRTTPAA